MKHAALLAVIALAPSFAPAQDGPKPWSGAVGENTPAFRIRSGFKVSLAATDMPETRFIEVDDKGTLYVSQPKAGKILAFKDTNNDGVYDANTEFVTGKRRAHGMHYKNGWLWFSTTGSINKARDTDGDGKADEVVTVIPDGQLPHDGGHWWRSILVTDDGLYTSIGDAGNMDEPAESKGPKDFNSPERQRIFFFNHDGSGKKEFASGVRNTEKLRVRPGTNQIYGCDHGSDQFGARYGETGGPGKQPITDLNPPCEFNLYEEGKFYGHPWIVGNRVPRLEFLDKRKDLWELAGKTTPPAWCFGAHWAPNGWTFLSKDSAIGKKGDAIVAFHGSWNSSDKVGYKIERVLFDPETGRPFGTQTLVNTLAEDGKMFLARPVDCVEAADGSILFSCDETRKVFRLSAAQ
jgi:glucose/arabinose dehydrogenase